MYTLYIALCQPLYRYVSAIDTWSPPSNVFHKIRQRCHSYRYTVLTIKGGSSNSLFILSRDMSNDRFVVLQFL